MTTNHRFMRAGAIAVAAIIGAAAFAAPAHAARPSTPPPGSTYVALGSSYAAGGGLIPDDPGDIGGACGRSSLAYPELVAQELGLNLINATCGGATTANIAATPQVVRNENGTWTLPAQADAVTADTALVTLTIGGNDVSYVGALMAESCLSDLAANPASELGLILQQYGVCTPPSADAVAAALRGVQGKIADAVRAVQAKAPHARIILVDYLTVLPDNGKPCALLPIAQTRQKELVRLARDLSAATKKAALQTGAEFVAASHPSRAHDACSRDPWVTGYAPTDNFMHPNAVGQSAVADLVVREVVH